MTQRGKKKIGRNAPCPCGSGTKYKKCHGRLSAKPIPPSPEKIQAILETHKAKEARRVGQQGQGRPIISTEFQGYRFTAVGNNLHYAKTHKTFIDFLGDYVRTLLDPKWGNAEIAKPLKDRHPILQWYDALCALQQKSLKKPAGEIQEMPITGLVAAYYGLAYNLYLLQHNAELQEYLLRRLKQHEGFYAAYYETHVAAWFILAGFELHLEDEQDSSKTHPEFVATRDGQSYSVEAKTRQPYKEHFDVGNQLYKALCKEAHYERVIFIDMNVEADVDFEAFTNESLSAIRGRESKLKIHNEPAPSAFVFVTNQPYHLALDKTHLPRACLAVGFKIPDFGHGTQFASYTEAYKAQTKYGALNDVQKAMGAYSIPVTFDGEISQFAFGDAQRRFTIGECLEIADGSIVTLQSGIVVEKEQKAYLVVADQNDQGHIVTVELSNAELAAYKSHPDTFFNRVVPVSEDSDDPLDLYEFFINGYKETPREKLLELMGGRSDLKKLQELSDEDLLFAYAEGLTQFATRDRNKVQ